MRDDGRLDTRLIHGGEISPRVYGAASLPIFQSSVFEQSAAAEVGGVRYPRLSNTPNHLALQEKIASIEGAEAALVTASGMAAIAATLIETLGRGGHLLVQDGIYGGTWALLLEDFPRLGLSHDFIDPLRPETWAAKLRPETRAIYTESIANPLLVVADHRAVVDFARSKGIVSIVDATFTSPVNWRAIEFGYDLSIHSATKYLNGHSDLVAGCVAGKKAKIAGIRRRLVHFGGHLDMHACWLLHRGIKTLALRVRRQNENAAAVAAFLAGRPDVKRVNYPGLPGARGAEHAREWFEGMGGVLSFELDDARRAQILVENLVLPVAGPSVGGIDSLVTRPVTSSHLAVPKAERERAGISDALVRYSAGIEAAEDLIDDLARALEIASR